MLFRSLNAIVPADARLTDAKGIPASKPPAASAVEGSLNPADSPHWQTFQGLMTECRDAHRRNDILIRNKLDTIRATLRILQNSENSHSVDVYDRMGRIAPQMNRRGYSDA